ncbi:hypothetical protein [Mesorhizobium sp. M0488]|uniref:hypothetical protein n=1 Tax=unclassified Mesorhizobium TaxID=325217 RepID=UPI00333B8CA8
MSFPRCQRVRCATGTVDLPIDNRTNRLGNSIGDRCQPLDVWRPHDNDLHGKVEIFRFDQHNTLRHMLPEKALRHQAEAMAAAFHHVEQGSPFGKVVLDTR